MGNETLLSLTWEMLARKNIKKPKRLVLRLETLYLVKNIFCLYFSPIPKLWSRKKVVFKVFVFSRYSKTLSLHFHELVWRFQQRCSSKITPRYLTLLQVLVFRPLILKLWCFVICFCLGQYYWYWDWFYLPGTINRLKQDLDLLVYQFFKRFVC